jgi:hypothetical protein
LQRIARPAGERPKEFKVYKVESLKINYIVQAPLGFGGKQGITDLTLTLSCKAREESATGLSYLCHIYIIKDWHSN